LDNHESTVWREFYKVTVCGLPASQIHRTHCRSLKIEDPEPSLRSGIVAPWSLPKQSGLPVQGLPDEMNRTLRDKERSIGVAGSNVQ
jgi:hypothetical protein